MARKPKKNNVLDVYVVAPKLDNFEEAIVRARPELYAELGQELESFGSGVAARARQIAEAKGLHQSGRLIAGITHELRGAQVLIGDTAHNPQDGYPYPGRLEFGDLDQPFLQPALAEKQDEGLARLAALVERILNRIARS